MRSDWQVCGGVQSVSSVHEVMPGTVTGRSTLDEITRSTRPDVTSDDVVAWRITITVGKPAAPRSSSRVTSCAESVSEPVSGASHSTLPLLPPWWLMSRASQMREAVSPESVGYRSLKSAWLDLAEAAMTPWARSTAPLPP